MTAQSPEVGSRDGPYTLVGVPPDRPDPGPRSYGPGESYGAPDMGHVGAGTLELLVPDRAVSKPYWLALEVRVEAPDGTTRDESVMTVLNVV